MKTSDEIADLLRETLAALFSTHVCTMPGRTYEISVGKKAAIISEDEIMAVRYAPKEFLELVEQKIEGAPELKSWQQSLES